MKLWLDDTRQPPDNTWKWVKTVKAATTALSLDDFGLASLDHDLGYGEPTGYELVKWMVENEVWPSDGIVVHSWNPVGAENMVAMIDRYGPYDKACVRQEAKWYISPDPEVEKAFFDRLDL